MTVQFDYPYTRMRVIRQTPLEWVSHFFGLVLVGTAGVTASSLPALLRSFR